MFKHSMKLRKRFALSPTNETILISLKLLFLVEREHDHISKVVPFGKNVSQQSCNFGIVGTSVYIAMQVYFSQDNEQVLVRVSPMPYIFMNKYTKTRLHVSKVCVLTQISITSEHDVIGNLQGPYSEHSLPPHPSLPIITNINLA